MLRCVPRRRPALLCLLLIIALLALASLGTLDKTRAAGLPAVAPAGLAVQGLSILDLGQRDPALRMDYSGGFADRDYGYLTSWDTISSAPTAGTLVRFDLRWFNPSSVVTLDLTTVDQDLYGFAGGFSYGQHSYLMPGWQSSQVARVDRLNFTPAGVEFLDLRELYVFGGYAGSFGRGRYAYAVPFNSTGIVPRIDLQNFSLEAVQLLNLRQIDQRLERFGDGFSDGSYGYFVPNTHGVMARVDLASFRASAVVTLDLTLIDGELRRFAGSAIDDGYAYLGPVGHSKLVRVDLDNFSPAGVQVLDLAPFNAGFTAIASIFTDRDYIYLVPFNEDGDPAQLVRVEQANFSAEGVALIDLAQADAELISFTGGFSESSASGRCFGYLISGPYNVGKVAQLPLACEQTYLPLLRR